MITRCTRHRLAAATLALAALAFAQDAAVPPGSTRSIRFGGQLRGRMEAPAGS